MAERRGAREKGASVLVSPADVVEDFAATAQALAGQVQAARDATHRAVWQHVSNRVSMARKTTKTTKSERTRRRILEAASQLIHDTGGTDFQMSEVAELCDMSKGALYYYFPDRDAIVEEIFNEVIEKFAADLERIVASSSSAEDALRSMMKAFCVAVRDGELFVVAMASDLLRAGTDILPQLKRRFHRISQIVAAEVECAKEEGFARSDLNSDVAAASICGGVLFATSRQIALEGQKIDINTVTEALYDIVIAGIRA